MLRVLLRCTVAYVLVALVLVVADTRGVLAEGGNDLVGLKNRVLKLAGQGHYAEAVEIAQRALALEERLYGPNHSEFADSLHYVASLYRTMGRYDEAERLGKRSLGICEKLLGPNHLRVAVSLNDLAIVYTEQGRYPEAEQLHQRALAIKTKVLGPDHLDVARSLNNLAFVYQAQGRDAEAEPLFSRALVIREQALGPDHPMVGKSLEGLTLTYLAQGRDTEAEPLAKRALAITQKALGPDHPDVGKMLDAIGGLYHTQGRYDDAEPFFRRAIAIDEKVLGPNHPDLGRSLSNLALLYQAQGRYGEAEPLSKRALAIFENVLGPDHPDLVYLLNNLAVVYQGQGNYVAAEPLYKRALAIAEHVRGPDHPDVAVVLNGLANLRHAEGRDAEAETLLQRALAITEKALGADHPYNGIMLHSLAAGYFQRGDWTRAADFWRRGARVVAHRVQYNSRQALTGRNKNEAERWDFQFWGLVKAVNRLVRTGDGQDAALTREMFQTAQWAVSSEAAQSLAKMAARGAKGDPKLAVLVRERQDLITEWQRRDGIRSTAFPKALEKRDAKSEAANATRLDAIDARILEIDGTLTTEFPDYAALVSPAPVSVEAVQALLGDDEALVLFLDTPEAQPTPEETFIWVVTKTDSRWVRTDLGRPMLNREVQALRCGLDEEQWATPTEARRCADLLALTEMPDLSKPLPFHLGRAHALYLALFSQIEDLIAGKRLLIVPSGALTSLPFQVLVTKAPATALPDTFLGYRNVAWLGQSNAIATLPAVSSLKALREHAPNRKAASDAYAGYGNPVLSGDGTCRVPKALEKCPTLEAAVPPTPLVAEQHTASIGIERATPRGRGGRRSDNATTDKVYGKGATPEALLAQVRELCPLPDTAYEIKCVAERFTKKAPLIRLAREASETDIKTLSESGELESYGVLHFATHGLLSGDVERMTKRQGEPALVLTPPDKPANADDDGLLMASEIAALKLNADWVVLSACNTAAGDKIGAQALSGLARAFFYAGGRALLVSHWPVYSDAAVQLTTRAFAEFERHPNQGRAEALQHAMIEVLNDPQEDNAHPAVWAPFVVVGEGGR